MESQSASFYSVAFIPSGVDPRDDERLVDVTESVYSVEIVDHERKKDTCNLTLDNHLLDKLDSNIWLRGSKFRVIYGHADRRSPARVYVLTKLSGGRVLNIEMTGREAIMDTFKTRRVFNNVRRSDVIKQIAEEYGFDASFVEDTDHVHESLVQPNITDYAFVNRLARKEGYQFWLDDEGFHFKERKVGERPISTLIYHVDPNKGDILDFNFETKITGKPARVTMKGRDPLQRENISVSQDNETDKDRDTTATEALTFGPGDSAKAINFAIETVNNLKKDLKNVRSGEEDVPTAGYSSAEVQAEAKGRFRRVQQSIVKLSVTLRGNASLLAKSVITIQGMGKRFSGKYYIQSATHTLSGTSGYVTTLALSSDGVNGGRGAAGLTAEQIAGIRRCLEGLRQLFAIETQSTTSTAPARLIELLIRRLEAILAGPISRVGLIAQQSIENLYELLSYGRRASEQLYVNVATTCIQELKPITVVSVDFEANTGNLNDKEALADDELETVLTFAPGDRATAVTGDKKTLFPEKQQQDYEEGKLQSNQQAKQSLESQETRQSTEVEFKKRRR